MDKLRILFVCAMNRLRSRTAEQVFSGRDDLAVRSAGLNPKATVVLSADLISWADTIFVMETSHRQKIRHRFRGVLSDDQIVCLSIPDEYTYMQPELVNLLIGRVTPHLRRSSRRQGDSDGQDP